MHTIIKHRLLKHSYKKLFPILNLFNNKKDYVLYFAYGANLSIDRFNKLGILAEEIGSACLRNYELRYNLQNEYLDKGYAGANPKAGSEIWGTLFKVEKRGMHLLDILEWEVFGMYERVTADVVSGENNYPNTSFYITKAIKEGLFAPKKYHEFILAQAKKRSFPKSYIDHIESLPFKEHFELDTSFRLSNPSKKKEFFPKNFIVYI